MSTPSPSKRARIPTTSAAPSVSASTSPFPTGPTTRPANGPRSVPPSGLSAMSPADAFSPANMDSLGFTPYSTTSPAYTAGAGITAASPISAALAHGSRVLSNIQASTPFMPPAYARPIPGGAMMQPPPVQQQKPQAPQAGSPEFLRLALQHLQTTLLGRLESEAESFFDAVDGSLGLEGDTRVVKGRAEGFKQALESVLAWVEKNGLASIPLLPLPEADTAQEGEAGAGAEAPASQAIEKESEAIPKEGAAESTKEAAKGRSLEEEISQLQQQAKELFDRRQRLKESASIVTGILDS